MANFIEKTLEPNEQVIFQGRLHWYFNFRYTVWGFILILAGLIGMGYIASGTMDEGTQNALLIICAAGAVIGLAFIFYGYFLRIKTEFAVTNTRFIQKDGIFSIRLTEIPLFKVETVNFEQSFIERIIGTGAIELVGSGGTNHKIQFVQKPFEVRNIITTYMKENKGEAPTTTAPSAPSANNQQ